MEESFSTQEAGGDKLHNDLAREQLNILVPVFRFRPILRDRLAPGAPQKFGENWIADKFVDNPSCECAQESYRWMSQSVHWHGRLVEAHTGQTGAKSN
jgi:hypothetical protein